MLKIFHLVGTPKQGKGENPRPYNLAYKLLPCTKLKKSFLTTELIGLLVSYNQHDDLIDLRARWSSSRAKQDGGWETSTREDKLVSLLELMLSKNMLMVEDIKDVLSELQESLSDQVYTQCLSQSIAQVINYSSSSITPP